MIQFTEITDFEAPELDVFARLTEAQLLNRFEPKKGMLIAESPKVIQRALDGGCVPVSLLVERGHCNEEAQQAIARCGDVPVYTASMDILTKLTGFQLTRGMLCAMLRPRQPAAEEILSRLYGCLDPIRQDFPLWSADCHSKFCQAPSPGQDWFQMYPQTASSGVPWPDPPAAKGL